MKEEKRISLELSKKQRHAEAALNKRALRFYRGAKADNPELCASDFVFACHEFAQSVRSRLDDRPERHENQKSTGLPQTLPSQRVIDVVPALHQLADYLEEKHTLRGRVLLGTHACEQLLGNTGHAFRVPGLKLGRGWSHRELTDKEVTRIRKAFDAADGKIAKDYSFIFPEPKELLPNTEKELLRVSNGLTRDLPIETFVKTLDAEAIRNMAKRARIAAFELQSATEIWGPNDKNSERNLTMTEIRNSPPIYRWITEALRIGWDTQSEPLQRLIVESEPDQPYMNREDTKAPRRLAATKRPSARESRKNPFEEEFSEFVADAIKLIPDFARLEYGTIAALEFLSGSDVRSGGKHCNCVDPLEKASCVARNFARRIVRLREQIIILGDHSETLSRWRDVLAAIARPELRRFDKGSGPKAMRNSDRARSQPIKESELIDSYAWARMDTWRQHCKYQYRMGILSSGDARRRGVLLAKALGVETLRAWYCQEPRARSRFANVDGAEMLKLLGLLHYDKRTRGRLKKLLSRFGKERLPNREDDERLSRCAKPTERMH